MTQMQLSIPLIEKRLVVGDRRRKVKKITFLLKVRKTELLD